MPLVDRVDMVSVLITERRFFFHINVSKTVPEDFSCEG
jgi:hypothetical protein